MTTDVLLMVNGECVTSGDSQPPAHALSWLSSVECSDQSLCPLQHIKLCTGCPWLHPPCSWSCLPQPQSQGQWWTAAYPGCVWVWAPRYRVWLNILTAYCLWVYTLPHSCPSVRRLRLRLDPITHLTCRRRFVAYRRWIVRYRLRFVDRTRLDQTQVCWIQTLNCWI